MFCDTDVSDDLNRYHNAIWIPDGVRWADASCCLGDCSWRWHMCSLFREVCARETTSCRRPQNNIFCQGLKKFVDPLFLYA